LKWNNYWISAEMVAVDHYLYADKVVGVQFGRILGTLFEVIGYGRWEREMYMGDFFVGNH